MFNVELVDEADLPPDLIFQPPWWPDNPYDPISPIFDPGTGAIIDGGDPVYLFTGAHLYLPGPDIVAYNPYGPNAVYQRNYSSVRAREGYASPGLSTGWFDNFDARIVETSTAAWAPVDLKYPNGSRERFIPLKNTYLQPSGEFLVEQGSSYRITGDPDTEVSGRWQSIKVTWIPSGIQWAFTPTNSTYTPGDEVYVLSKITNRVGKSINIHRGINNRVEYVTDDSDPANTLLTLNYDVNGYLDYVNDAYGRKIEYTFGPDAGATCLLSVSQISATSETDPPVKVIYDYNDFSDNTIFNSKPHIISISIPSPTGNGLSTQAVRYDEITGKVNALVDANDIHRVYTYGPNFTRIAVKQGESGVEESFWIRHFEPVPLRLGGYRTTGIEDALGRRTTLVYENPHLPMYPTTVIDKDGKTRDLSYDVFGNVITASGPRGATKSFDRHYSGNLYGLPRHVWLSNNDLTIDKMQAEYEYTSTGLLTKANTLKPGTTTGELVFALYEYDALGNITRIDSPGKTTERIITLLNYLTDGTYSQPAKRGQPLTITNNLGHAVHFRYDTRGNIISATDAEGNEVKHIYNIADQTVISISPVSP